MRTTCFALALLVLPVMASAQSAQAEKHHPREAAPAPSAEAPRPGSLGSIGLPLPSIGLPLPPIGIQPVPGSRLSVPGTDDPVYAPGYVRHQRPSVVYVVSPYQFGNGYAAPVAAPAASGVTVFSPEPKVGTLRLDVDPPGRWQLFVDSVFYGTADDLGGEVNLPAGPRRIEIRAPGYQPLIFDARIELDRTITYRSALVPVAEASRPSASAPPVASTGAPATPPPVVATGSRTIYVIPGCYVGNVPPQKEKLREGCDLSGLKTVTPQH